MRFLFFSVLLVIAFALWRAVRRQTWAAASPPDCSASWDCSPCWP
jgi:hypothetical protein